MSDLTTQIESLQFSCPSCGKRLGARADQAGRSYRCPGCGEVVRVPTLSAPAEPSPAVVEQAVPAGGLVAGGPPKTTGELLLLLLGGWSAIVFVGLIAMFFGSIVFYFALAVIAAATFATAYQALRLLSARQTVLHEKNVSLLFGMVRLIAWDPTEGVLILRDKSVSFHDDDLHDGKGGVRFIYPVLGEELALRVPLEVQTLHYSDDNVLTREYLGLKIRGTMKWRIVDIERFYLQMSRELRSTREAALADPRVVPKLDHEPARATTAKLVDAAIEWLRGLAEEQTRLVVSRVRSGLLLADRMMSDVPEVRAAIESPAAAAEFGGASEGLASAIHATLSDRLKEYGLSVVDVSLQEIGMPQAIVEQCAKACKTAYLPLMAHRQASAKHADLRAEVDVLGKEAVGAREIVSNAPAYALGDFLTKFITARTPSTPGGNVPTIDVAALAAAEETKAIEG